LLDEVLEMHVAQYFLLILFSVQRDLVVPEHKIATRISANNLRAFVRLVLQFH